MKLLDKKSINSSKASEKKLEIDEAVKLAKRLVEVRKTLAEEEKKLKVFREATTQTILDEIASLGAKKNDLEGKVADLTEARKSLQKPLDDEWKVVNDKSIVLAQKEEELAQKDFFLKSKEQSLLEKQKELNLEEERIVDLESQANRNHNLSTKELARAESVLKEAYRHQSEVESEVKERIQAVVEREDASARKEKELGMRQDFLNSRERKIDEEARRVKDLYQTLLRSQQRIHGKRI